MERCTLVGVLTLLYTLVVPCTCLLDNVGDADLEAVRYRLQDEKEKRLLLENDVETMMLKLAELERRCKKDSTGTEATCQCPYGFVQRANRCYIYVPVEATWIEAQMYCTVFGGSLASIETPEELTVVRDYLQSSKATDQVWIDGTDALNEGIWHWTKSSDHQTMIGKAGLGIWTTGQPDDWSNNEDCARLAKHIGQYVGNDSACSAKYHFICEAQ